MSALPTTVLAYTAGDRFLLGRRMVFAWPTGNQAATPEALLAALNHTPPRGNLAEIEAELRRRLNEHARKLPLPAAAAVLGSARPGDPACRHLLSVLTVLAKSSAHVYLRDKEPNLAILRPGRCVVLLLPEMMS
jgi:hypothetical protein